MWQWHLHCSSPSLACADGDADLQYASHRVESACALAAHVTWSSTSCSHYWASSRACCTHCTSSGPGPGVTPAAAHTTVRSCTTMWSAHVQAMRQSTGAIVQGRLPFETCLKLYIVSPWMCVWLCRPCAHTATRATVPAFASWPAANSAVRRRCAGKLRCTGAHSQLGDKRCRPSHMLLV